MTRLAINIAYKIRFIVDNYCEDITTKHKWLTDLYWFYEFEKNIVQYWNQSPESKESYRWNQLNYIVNKYIKDDGSELKYFEDKIVKIYIDQENGTDIPNIPDLLYSGDYFYFKSSLYEKNNNIKFEG